MSQDREHPDFEVLSDLLDGYLSKGDAEVVSEHLSVCMTCAEAYRSLQGFVSSASALPKSVLPPEDVWSQLRKSLEERKEVVLPTSRRDPDRESRSIHTRRPSCRLEQVVASCRYLRSSPSGPGTHYTAGCRRAWASTTKRPRLLRKC